MRNVFCNFLFGVCLFSICPQDATADQLIPLDSLSDVQLMLDSGIQRNALTFSDEVAIMVKQVLGEVYFEVEYIPESQWIEMEPIAEEYVRCLFQARQTPDDDEANSIMQAAQAKFDAAINAKLTSVQKNKRTQKRQYFQEESRRLQTQMQSTSETLLQQQNATAVSNSGQNPVVPTPKIITIEYK